MPKPDLRLEYRELEQDIISTLEAGLKEWRSDLSYPQSYSDMQGCVRALLRMFDVKRRPLALETSDLLEPQQHCDLCDHQVSYTRQEMKLCYTHMKEQGLG